MIIKEYYEKLCTNKLNDIKEREKFLDELDLQVLDYESQKYLNRPMMNKRSCVSRSLPWEGRSGQGAFMAKFYQTFTEGIAPSSYSILKSYEEKVPRKSCQHHVTTKIKH